MKTFRYRRLIIGDRHVEVIFSGDRFRGYDSGGATYDVDAVEDVADFDTLVEKLKRGRLMPSDLVFADGQWWSFSEAPEFYEHCEGIIDERVLDQKTMAIVMGILAFMFFLSPFLLSLVAGWR
jgi:hypothetical protein